MAPKDNLQIAKETVAAINAHDIEGYLKHIDESYAAESETLGAIHGREGARKAMTTMLQAFLDVHVEIEQLLASGDHVISRVIVTGTHKGSFAGIAPTNKKATWHSCSIIEMHHGKVIRSRMYADNLSLMRQIGVLPASKATTAG